MPGTSSRRYGAKRYAKKPTKKKAALSRYGKQARARRALATKVSRAKGVKRVVKKAVVSNSREIAKLKDATFGTSQTNCSIMDKVPLIVSDNRPTCLHLNNLHSTGDQAPTWIRAHHQILGSIQPIMDSYEQFSDWRRPVNHQDQILQTQDEPEGERILWKSSRFDIAVTAWVENANVDFMIVKQKVRDIRDPWRNMQSTGSSPHSRYLPYCLPTFRNSAGPHRETKIDPKQFQVIMKKRVHINSLGYTVTHTMAHDSMDRVTEFAEASMGHSEGNDAELIAKGPTTRETKHISMTIRPNKVLKRIYNESHLLGFEPTEIDANPMEDKTGAPYDFDNFEPRDNYWLIVTSDDGGDGAMFQDHRTTFTCKRTNYWRDLSTNTRTAQAAGVSTAQVDSFNYAAAVPSIPSGIPSAPSIPMAGISIP